MNFLTHFRKTLLGFVHTWHTATTYLISGVLTKAIWSNVVNSVSHAVLELPFPPSYCHYAQIIDNFCHPK